MEYVFRPPVLLCIAMLIFCFNLSQPAQKAGIANQVTRPAVVRMAVVERICQYNFRLVFA